jgi:hypothetical protein
MLTTQEKELQRFNATERMESQLFMPTASDTSVRAFRSWFKNEGQGQPKWAVGISNSDSSSSSSGDLTREALLERYHSHTKNCKSCREALADVQKVSSGTIAHSLLVLS